MKLRTLLIAAASLAMAGGAAGAASAATPWQHHHRGRVEVNHRLGHLNRSINQERREGDLNHRQAMRMHAHVRHIRMQERRMAARHGGHLTWHERARLNHEESGVHNHIPG
ncbi:MAG: hypothetical protein ACREEW_00105 [Caulobacteraceae bacterium]